MNREIREAVRERGIAGSNAIPEQYPLLRTIQFVVCGYYKVVEKPQKESQ